MKFIALLLMTCAALSAQAQSNNDLVDVSVTTHGKAWLLPAAQRVEKAYLAWKTNPTSSVRQQAFIAAFPTTAKAFTAIFDPKDFGQLYDGHEYIEVLGQVGVKYPSPVLRRGIAICKTIAGISDAPSYIRHVTIQLSLKYPRLFADEVARLTSAERKALFKMWADEEGIAEDLNYTALTRLMNENGFSIYGAELQRAKQWRMQQPNH
ncbi:hypothetical protein [Hymenobacter sp. BRD67]|uniref:hypothetical protein n=1 Tax=Hymenobacter sp. BRD67 TaxID=2675877 RepID=UPI001565547F|nr:hypothetical protein [Hymenobacter sp. BRD67]QKG54018.1 hypothetical protein GKZ67_17165 [Hymenobacter sp. BRD67]